MHDLGKTDSRAVLSSAMACERTTCLPHAMRLKLPKNIWKLLAATIRGWIAHEGPRLAASLSLYSLLSLAPLVILSIWIASFAFGRHAAQAAVIKEVHGMMGDAGASAVQSVIEYGKAPQHADVASLLGIITLLFGASSVFGELQSALNKIWNAAPSDDVGVMALIRSRLFSFAMVLSLGFLLLISLLFSTVLAALSGYLSQRLSIPTPLLATASEIFSLSAVTALIAVIFKYVPDRRLRWRDVWEGALATAVLFTVGKWLLGFYLGKAAVGSAYGAAGSIIVVIVWVYYSAMIFYFGAEFTRVRAEAAKAADGS
jgi:membrane protein